MVKKAGNEFSMTVVRYKEVMYTSTVSLTRFESDWLLMLPLSLRRVSIWPREIYLIQHREEEGKVTHPPLFASKFHATKMKCRLTQIFVNMAQS